MDKPKIHISYGNDEEGFTQNLISKIERNIDKTIPYLDVIYDRKSLEIGNSVSTFIKELTDSTRLIIIINSKYLESEYGMLELIKIFEYIKDNSATIKKYIFPIACKIQYFKASQLDHIKKHWEKKLEEIPKEYEDEVNQILDFINFIPEIPNLLGDLYTLPCETLEGENFVPLIWNIYKKSLNDYIRHYIDESDIEKALRSCREL